MRKALETPTLETKIGFTSISRSGKAMHDAGDAEAAFGIMRAEMPCGSNRIPMGRGHKPVDRSIAAFTRKPLPSGPVDVKLLTRSSSSECRVQDPPLLSKFSDRTRRSREHPSFRTSRSWHASRGVIRTEASIERSGTQGSGQGISEASRGSAPSATPFFIDKLPNNWI